MEVCKICLGKGVITCLAPEGIKEKYYAEICKECFGLGLVIKTSKNE